MSKKLVSVNPSNYEEIGSVDISSEAEIRDKVTKAHKTKEKWSQIGVEKRVEMLEEVFEEFAKRKQEFAELVAKEMGMPINEALFDMNDSAGFAKWYFDNAEKNLAPELITKDKDGTYSIYREPYGVVAAITPWNFPFANFVWAVVQSLVAGNVIVFKHSEEVPLCAKLIEEIVGSGKLPKGVFQVVYGDGEQGEYLVKQDIDMLAFTGSCKVGRYLYGLAGKKFIKAVMELGGSAPGVVFEDSDVEKTVEHVVVMRLLNQGQCCDGLKRLIVHKSIADEVTQKLTKAFEAKKVGDASKKETEIGPLVAKRQLDLLEVQVKDALDKGAEVVTGGKNLEKELGGAFYQPTILRNIKKNMRVWKEEVFGPVLPVVSFEGEEVAVELANDTEYGLGGYVYSGDVERAERVAQKIDTGMVSINGTNYIMPCNPFGGCKASGFGREHGRFGFEEVTQVKLVSKPN